MSLHPSAFLAAVVIATLVTPSWTFSSYLDSLQNQPPDEDRPKIQSQRDLNGNPMASSLPGSKHEAYEGYLHNMAPDTNVLGGSGVHGYLEHLQDSSPQRYNLPDDIGEFQ